MNVIDILSIFFLSGTAVSIEEVYRYSRDASRYIKDEEIYQMYIYGLRKRYTMLCFFKWGFFITYILSLCI